MTETASSAYTWENEAQNIPPLPRVSVHIFCETENVAASVEAATLDRRMEKVHVKVQMGGASVAVQAYKHAPTPNLIVLETQGARTQLLEQLDKLARVCDEGTRVLIIGHLNDVVLYRELLKRGVSDYLMAPFEPFDFLKAVADVFVGPDTQPIGKTYAFIGAKGGVGASTIAHNIAWAMSTTLDAETTIADLDVAFGTAGLDLNQDPTQTISDALFSIERVDAAFMDRLLSKCSHKLSLLAAPAILDKTIDCSEETFDIILDAMKVNVPNIVVDMPHIWTSWSKKVMTTADQVVIVAEPDLACLRNAKNMIDLLQAHRPNDAAPMLVLNKMGMPKRPEIGAEHFIKACDIEPMAIIPFDAGLFGTAANNGQMIAESQPSSKTAHMFADLAQKLAGTKNNSKVLKSGLTPIVDRLKQWVKA